MEKGVVRQSRRSYYRDPDFFMASFFFFFFLEVGGGRNLLLPRRFSYPALKKKMLQMKSILAFVVCFISR